MTKGQGGKVKKRECAGPSLNTCIGYHTAANIMPMMDELTYQGLLTDMGTHGQLSPIWLYEGLIVDGRNRYRACLELGIKPWFQEWGGQVSLVDFVISLNVIRRHLTTTQKATAAFHALPVYESEAKERQRAAGVERAATADRNGAGLLVPTLEHLGRQRHQHQNPSNARPPLLG